MDRRMVEGFRPDAMEVWSCSVSEEEEEERSLGSQGEEEEEEERRRRRDTTGVVCRELVQLQVLCSDRVGQVTKTYHDIDAVTHLLEEKERDLELAARIGQSLLKQNRELSARNEVLDEQLEIAKEEISQLRHELSMRDDLLHLYASSEEFDPISESRSPTVPNESPSNPLSNYIHYDFLHQKLKGLEEENLKLRCEADELTTETTSYEEQEQELMMVCVEELSAVNKRVVELSEDLARKVEDSFRQQEEISFLLAQIVDLQARCKGITTENEELTQLLNASREDQSRLKSDLRELQERYCECEDMLREAREDMKNQRNRSLPNGTVQRYSALATPLPMDSLAAEIEGTFRKGLDSPAPIEYRNHPLRVFETVKVAKQASRLRSRCHSPAVPGSSPASSPASSHASTPRTSCYGSDSASLPPDYRLGNTHHDDRPSNTQPADRDQGSNGGGAKRLGQPGTPGGQDLEAALRCLSARQRSHASQRPFFDVERERKLRAIGGEVYEEDVGGASEDEEEEVGGVDDEASSGFLTPNGSVAASSHVSTGTNYSNGSSARSGGSGGSGGSRSYLPDRLQIVKPLEGSVTLHQWQLLAKPNLDGILHPRPGVLTKDFRPLEVDLQHVYSLNDLEEDEEEEPRTNTMATAHGTMASTLISTSSSTLHPPVLITSYSTSVCSQSLPPAGNSEHLSTSPSPLPPPLHHHHHQHLGLNIDSMLGGSPLLPSTKDSIPSSAPLSLGLVRRLQEQGITASARPHPSSFSPTNSKTEEQEAGSSWREDEEEGEGKRKSGFSFNLVEKLWGLGLHKVATLGLGASNGREGETVSHPLLREEMDSSTDPSSYSSSAAENFQ